MRVYAVCVKDNSYRRYIDSLWAGEARAIARMENLKESIDMTKAEHWCWIAKLEVEDAEIRDTPQAQTADSPGQITTDPDAQKETEARK